MKHLCILGLAFLVLSCSDRQRGNPLDPQVDIAQSGLLSPLQAIALDGQVVLRWDFSRYSDIEGYRIYRRLLDRDWGAIAGVLAPETTEYTDLAVENGTGYEYRLGLLVAGEAERFADGVVRATPGAERAWVADRSTGLVWQISADARTAHFAQGRFRDLADIAIDAQDGSCWVSDQGFEGLYRIDAEGELATLKAAVERPGALAIDARDRIGWLADKGRGRVVWFALADTDSLELFVVDASFVDPVALAAQQGGCWIADRAQGRAMLYQTDGSRQVEYRSLSAPVALAADAEGAAWLLVDEGRGLLRVDRFGQSLEADLPFATAVRIAVDAASGSCWALGERDIAVFSPEGVMEQHWTDVPGGSGLSFDPVHRRAWIGTGSALWKFGADGQTIARLDGFTSIFRIVVNPGR